jgi:hypothetical protein
LRDLLDHREGIALPSVIHRFQALLRTDRHGWLSLCLIILGAALLWFDLLATWITDRYSEPVIVTGWIMAGLTAIAAIVLGKFVVQAPGQLSVAMRKSPLVAS